jgi:hypothetical protein
VEAAAKGSAMPPVGAGEVLREEGDRLRGLGEGARELVRDRGTPDDFDDVKKSSCF